MAKCRKCGGRLAGAALGGTCPRCMMACAISEPPDGIEDAAPGPILPPVAAPGRLPPRFGRYSLLKRLGSGAMGEVYLAFDSQMNRQVAVKTPHFERTADPTAIERFRREARLAAALSHPNICSVYDVGEVDGVLFYTMAYIDGVPLTRWIEDPRPMPVQRIVELVLQMASAMAHAHRHGIVHRDLKPANVMIDRRGEPVIMDFGLARHATFETRLTQSNAVVGTPAYLAPELIGGAEDAPATDVYALGVVLFELLTKQLPFSGPLGELLAKITRDPPPAPSQWNSGVPRRLDAICLRALAKNPNDRFATMDDFAAALTHFLRPTPSSLVRLWKWPTRDRLKPAMRYVIGGLTALVLALAVVIVVVIAGVVSRDRQVAQGDLENDGSSHGTTTGNSATGHSATGNHASATATPDGARPATGKTNGVPTATTAADLRNPDGPPEAARAKNAHGAEPPAVVARRVESGASRDRGDGRVGASSRMSAELLIERTRLAGERTTLDKPTDAPRSPLSMAESTLAEVRRIDTRRRELIERQKAIADRLANAIPEMKLKLTGDLAGSRRLGEEAVFELQQIDTRMGQLNVQRLTANGGLRTTIDQDLRALAQNRERVALRARGLDAEIRGKTVELGQVEKDASQLQQESRQLVVESVQLVEAAFWNADPAGSLDRAVYQALANEYAEWLRGNASLVEVLALRAVALANAGQADEGFREAQRALAQQPKSALVLSSLGYVKFVRGQTADAIADFNRAVRFAPQAPQALFFRGLANRRRGNQAAALDDLAAALAAAPGSPWIQSQWALQRAGTAASVAGAAGDSLPFELRQAAELGRQACESTRHQSWFCLDAYAAALAATDQWAEAVSTCEAAMTLAPPELRAAVRNRTDAYRSRQRFTF